MWAPEENVQTAGFTGCAAVTGAGGTQLMAPMLSALKGSSATMQHAALSLLAVSLKQRRLAFQAQAHLELAWALLTEGDASVSEAAARAFDALQMQPHFVETVAKCPELLDWICHSIDLGATAAGYPVAVQLVSSSYVRLPP